MRGAQDGFSLAELLVVLAIVALTAALALPGARQRGDVMSQASRVAALLRLARMEAMVSNAERVVAIDLGGNRIETVGKTIVLDADVAISVLTAREEMVRDNAAIRFLPDGSSTGGAVALQLNGTLARIKINWLTGAVTTDRGDALAN